MQIRQLQVARDAVQDRLTLRVATQANEEFRVWITRRYLRELWPHLVARLAVRCEALPQAPGESAATPAAPNFDQAFRDDNPRFPLGATPLLASEANLRDHEENRHTLTFSEGRERSLDLNLNNDLLQALCAMLRAAAIQAAWDLTLDYATPEKIVPATALPASQAKSGLLH